MYPNTVSHIVIQPGLIRMTKKLSYFQTEKLGSPDLKVGYLLNPNSYKIYSTSWWFSTALCIQRQYFTSRFILVWLEWQRSSYIPKQENWDHMILKLDNFFILTPKRFFQLPGDSTLLYVSKYNFSHRDSRGLIRMTKTLSYFKTGKMRSPYLKVG